MDRTPHAGKLALACAWFAAGLTCSEASAGIVMFEPETVFVEPGEATAAFELTIVADCQFDSGDFIIGSDLPIADFAFAPEFLAAMTGLADTFMPVGVYENDLFITGYGSQLVGPLLPLGTVGIDTSGAGPGSYQVWIESSDFFPNLCLDVEGHGFIVVPEPGTLSLLALGVLAILRRRRSAG